MNLSRAGCKALTATDLIQVAEQKQGCKAEHNRCRGEAPTAAAKHLAISNCGQRCLFVCVSNDHNHSLQSYKSTLAEQPHN